MLLAICLGAYSLTSHAQVLTPATWSTAWAKDEVAQGATVDLLFHVSIDTKWYLYSSDFDPDCGPTVTSFTFRPDPSYELVGGVRPIGAKKKYDDIFECDYTYFRGKALFRQTVRVLTSSPSIEGMYEYQVCTDVDGKCIAFDDTFGFTGIKVIKSPTGSVYTPEGNKDKAVDTTTKQKTSSKNTDEAVLRETDKPQKEDADELIDTLSAKNEPAMAEVSDTGAEEPSMGNSLKIKVMEPFFDGEFQKKDRSYLGLMLIAFLAGLTALLTPCVFPMIPMTVTFFTGKTAKGKGIFQAMFYGLSIVLIYTLIGATLSPLMGPETANHLATEWLPNVIFFIVFVVFALSFFGLFEITLPSGLVNAMDRKSDKGGLVGTFFMAFTLVLVSFSCTGPIVGSLLVASAGGEVLRPILGMFAFSMAFAIPFTLFAIFPSWLNKLPKSGGWLNSVKVVLGFVELALAFKFLSIADQAYHWGILDREVNIAIWIVIGTLLGFYLLGKIRLPHDSKMESVGVPRLLLAMITFSFVIYLVPGMYGAPLKSLSGYLPPMHTHDFNLMEPSGEGASTENNVDITLKTGCEEPKYKNLLHLPHGLQGYFDFGQAMACAKAQNKPLFIDFTGHGCTNCREMEAKVWSDPRVLKRLKEDYVIVALYVDDKTELSEQEWYTSVDGKVKKTMGKQNADLQIQRANNNAQPNYILLGHEEKALTAPIAYSDVDDFIQFLDEGKKQFQRSGGFAATR